MIDPAGRLHSTTTADGIVSVTSRSQPPESQSFAAELADKLASTLRSVAQSAELPASLPAGQQSARWRDPGGASASTSGSTPGSKPVAASQALDLINGFVINYPDTTSGASSASAAAATPVSFDSLIGRSSRQPFSSCRISKTRRREHRWPRNLLKRATPLTCRLWSGAGIRQLTTAAAAIAWVIPGFLRPDSSPSKSRPD